MNSPSYLLYLLLQHIILVNSCLLVGNVQGNCVSSNQLANFVDICQPYLSDYVCVPFNSIIWKEWNNATVNDSIYDIVIEQLSKKFINELDSNSMPLINNSRCLSSYLSLICKSNFKRCDPLTGTSFNLCTSLCSEFTYNCVSTQVTCSSSNGGSLPSV